MEIFKDIEGYKGLYQISNLGRVKSLKGKKERFLKANTATHGYLQINLSFNGKVKTTTIHTLVAISFLDHIPNGYKVVVDHIDNNKLNNSVDNLQLTTNRENCSKDRKNKSSKYTGVTWVKSRGKWLVQIMINSKYKHLGYFINEEEASEAYQKAINNLN